MDRVDNPDTLKIGDLVTLKNLRLDGYLGAEGILLEDVGVTGPDNLLDDAIFCIHLKRQYSASREYEEFVRKGSAADASASKYFTALKRGKDNEKKLNDYYMSARIAEDVRFGDTCQLFHVKSGKYLRVYPDQLAKEERQNLLVTLDSTGDVFSWLQLIPRYKVDRLGDPVRTNTELLLALAERSNEFIHAAEREGVDGRLREVNCSLEATAWRLTIFQSSTDEINAKQNKLVLASQIVYINDPEQRCNLALPHRSVSSLDDEAEAAPATKSGGGGERLTAILEAAEHEYFHEHGDIVLEPMGDFVGSRMLWYLEAKNPFLGGPIKWRTEQVRFRHVNTGVYLTVVPKTVIDETGEEFIQLYLTTTTSQADAGTLFNLNELYGTGKLLSLDKPIQISHGKAFFERGAVLDGFLFEARMTPEKSQAVGFKLFKYEEVVKTSADDSADAASAAPEPLDIFAGMTTRGYMRKYLDMTVMPKTNVVSTIWPTADRSDMIFFNSMMTKAVYFSQGFPISSTNIQLGVDKADTKIRIKRQDLFRDQGLLEVLLRIINRLVPISNRVDDSPKLLKTAIQITEEEQVLIRMGKAVLERCFTLLLYCVTDNAANQMYVADHMPVLLAHLGGQPLAGKCVTEMLASNIELQETKIGTREIAIFVDKLRSSKMNAMYLQLLKACCSCQGAGVDGNQCKVTDMLYSNTNDIIIHLHSDYARVTTVDWNADGLYIPVSPIPGSPIAAEVLYTRGLPQLSLAWTTNSIDFSPLGLFGRLSVAIEDLYKPTKDVMSNTGNKKLDEKKNASIEQKNSVANYFVAQMLLGAEMCMDRNYVAFHTLDPYFPIDMLITILKMDLNEEVQAAAARVILCLHIDRDPQAETKIPCLTRAWSEVKNSQDSEIALPYVEPGRWYTYGLLQQLISEHVRGMSGRRWGPLSIRVLQLLKRMVAFNFYGTNDRMRDVIGPLIRALDRRSLTSSMMDDSMNLSLNMTRAQSAVLEIEGGDGGEDDGSGAAAAAAAAARQKSFKLKKDILNVMEGFKFMGFILLLVLASVSVAIWETIDVTVDQSVGSDHYIFGVIVTAIFVIEISIRSYCFVSVKGTAIKFLCNAFNQIDILVIAIDLVFLGLPASLSAQGKYTKVLRLVRLIRLLRILRTARLISKVVRIRKKKEISTWKVPVRYSRCPQQELDAMVEAVEILQLAQNVIDDRNLTLLLKYFYVWESGEDRRTPGRIFDKVIEDSVELSLGIEDFDNVFVDVIMFTSPALVQSSLEILMAYHSTRRTLLKNAASVQLLASAKRERQFKIVDQMLQQLERNAETHELWGELKTEDDRSISKQTKDILKELIDVCRIRGTEFEFDEEYVSDYEIQNLYRNLGCFSICFKVMGLLDSVEEDEDGQLDEVGANTRSLCLLCNTLLYWFFLGNPENQELGYTELEFFLESLDAKINSHRVLRAIFKGNQRLMRLVPFQFLTNMTEKICKAEPAERSSYDLALMQAVTCTGESGVRENQIEVMKQLTSPGRTQLVASFFVGIHDPLYTHKRQLMKPFLKNIDVPIDQLPKELQYHLALLDVLSSLTVGMVDGITTIEAKIQSIYQFNDVIDAMLDPESLLVVKIKLGWYLFNGVVEVELKIPGLEYTNCIWKLLQDCDRLLSTGEEDFRKFHRTGWVKDLSRRRLEYHLICVMLVNGFLTVYYDPAEFRLDEHAPTTGDPIEFTSDEVHDLLDSLFIKINGIHRAQCRFLSEDHKALLATTVANLEKVTTSLNPIQMADLEKIPAEPMPDIVEDEDAAMNKHEAGIISKYKEFLEQLSSDDDVQSAADNESTEFIKVLESLPFIAAPVESDIRQETLFRKLVSHIRDNFKIVNNERRLDSRCTVTSIWVIKAFRIMIENRMGMSIYDRDEDGGQEQDEAVAPVIAALNACGATALCIDLIAVGIDPELQLEAVRLSVGMLYKEGGALEVQEIMNKHLRHTNSEYFFRQIHETIQNLIRWHRAKDVFQLPEGEDPKLPDELIFVRFIQLLSEGHYLPNQKIFKEQLHNPVSVNIMDDFSEYLECLSRLHCRTSTVAAIRVAATILEVLQGPCQDNQVHFAVKTELLETLNRVMRTICILDCVSEEEVELKLVAVDIFQGLLEGQPLGSIVYERVLNVIHMDIIMILSGNVKEEEGVAKRKLSPDEEVLETQCTVLLQILCDCKPSLRKELGLSTNLEDIMDADTACVEVIWNNQINRRFFHVPPICNDMAKSSMDNLVEYVDRRTQENKLTDFVERSRELYREIKHHQVLHSLHLSRVLSKTNFDRSTWVSFILSIIINGLFLGYYTAENHSEPHLAPVVVPAVNALNFCQIITSSFNLLIVLVVIAPVRYQTLISLGNSQWTALWKTALEFYPVYYFGYLLLSIFGVVFADYFLTFLLLDIIVKNSTTQSVLKAVYQPRWQLIYVVTLVIFMVYIYSYFLFTLYRDDVIPNPDYKQNCYSLWNCFKLSSAYGLRQGGGVGDLFVNTLGSRWILDVAFFLSILIVVLNLIFGIIIMTFSVLREEKAARMADTENICFICGIERADFDRASEKGDGFKTHIKLDQNMWNYVRFMIFLWEQDRDDDDGLEQYVRRRIDANDLSWFPINRAICLEKERNSDKNLLNSLRAKISTTDTALTTKLASVQQEVSVVLEQVTQALKLEHIGGVVEDDELVFTAAVKGGAHLETISENSTIMDHSGDYEVVQPSRAKCINVELQRLFGLDLPHELIFCTASCDGGQLVVIPARSTFEDGVTFVSKRLVVTRHATTDDTHIFRVRIFAKASVEDEMEQAMLIGYADFPYNELVHADGLSLDKYFVSLKDHKYGCISIFTTSIMQMLVEPEIQNDDFEE